MSSADSRRPLTSDILVLFTGTHMWFVVNEVALRRVFSFALLQSISLH